jgi:hypothetical protein
MMDVQVLYFWDCIGYHLASHQNVAPKKSNTKISSRTLSSISSSATCPGVKCYQTFLFIPDDVAKSDCPEQPFAAESNIFEYGHCLLTGVPFMYTWLERLARDQQLICPFVIYKGEKFCNLGHRMTKLCIGVFEKKRNGQHPLFW